MNGAGVGRFFLSSFLEACEQRPDQPFLYAYTEPYRMESFSFAAMQREAHRLTGYIHHAVGSGGMVFLLIEAVERLVPAWFGCLLAAAVPGILTPPTDKIDRARYLADLAHMLDRYPGAIVLCDDPVLAQLTGMGLAERLIPLSWVLDAVPALEMPADRLVGDRPLLFQQSSGTTQIRKGMVLSQDAVLGQLRAYGEAIAIGPDDRIISWLPLYHDMGLIACLAQATYHALPMVLCSPFVWLREPSWLLTAARRHRATLCWLPNFAFALLRRKGAAVRLPADCLAGVRLLINCSEPVIADTMNGFREEFSRFGLRDGALSASYAMAETVFAVTQLPPETPVPVEHLDRISVEREGYARLGGGITAVSSGVPLPGCQIDIRPYPGMPCGSGDGRIGEIHVKAPFLFTGYVGVGEEIPALDTDGWFATGDLGYHRDGHLFVLGRCGDRIIRAGRNLDPLPFEEAAGAVQGVKPGRVACFGLHDREAGTEEMILMAETDPALPVLPASLQAAIRRATETACGIAPQKVVLVQTGTLLKSSSGKISRRRCRELYVSTFATAPLEHA